MMKWILLLAVAAYVLAVVYLNRSALPDTRPLPIAKSKQLPLAGSTISVMTWNLGYAALGRESDFVADGGISVLAPSRAAVDKNLAGIVKVLSGAEASVLALQEIAVTSPLNYWRSVWRDIQESNRDAQRTFLPDMVTKLMPWPMRIEHGLATLAKVDMAQSESVPLPLEDKYWLKLFRKQYAALVTRYAIKGSERHWVIANIHLAAFDDGGRTRRAQLDVVLAFARREFEKGNFVIVAGDWNMKLGGRDFPHATEPRFIEWVRPLPDDMPPDRWRFVFDPEVATVRTLYKPYVAGENFITIIDGFLISPNVQPTSVSTRDLGFSITDHHPVTATFAAAGITE